MLNAVAATAAERGLSNIAVQQGAAEDLPFLNGKTDKSPDRARWRGANAAK